MTELEFGTGIATATAGIRSLGGSGAIIEWMGITIPCTMEAFASKGGSDSNFEQGFNTNMQNADVRILHTSPSFFPSGIPWPEEGNQIHLTIELTTHVYIVARVIPKSVGGVVHTLQLTAFREALPMADSANSSGQRKYIDLPANTYVPT